MDVFAKSAYGFALLYFRLYFDKKLVQSGVDAEDFHQFSKEIICKGKPKRVNDGGNGKYGGDGNNVHNGYYDGGSSSNNNYCGGGNNNGGGKNNNNYGNSNYGGGSHDNYRDEEYGYADLNDGEIGLQSKIRKSLQLGSLAKQKAHNASFRSNGGKSPLQGGISLNAMKSPMAGGESLDARSPQNRAHHMNLDSMSAAPTMQMYSSRGSNKSRSNIQNYPSCNSDDDDDFLRNEVRGNNKHADYDLPPMIPGRDL